MHNTKSINSANKKDNLIYLKGHKKSQASMKKKMEAQMEREASRVKVEQRYSMEIDNKVILEYLGNYMKDNTVENLKVVLESIPKCRFLVPAVPDEQKRPLPRIIKNAAGEKFLAIYSEAEQIPNEFRQPAVINMPFMDVVQISLFIDPTISGVVINPFKENFILQKAMLQKLYEVMSEELKAKMEQLKAEKEAEASAVTAAEASDTITTETSEEE